MVRTPTEGVHDRAHTQHQHTRDRRPPNLSRPRTGSVPSLWRRLNTSTCRLTTPTALVADRLTLTATSCASDATHTASTPTTASIPAMSAPPAIAHGGGAVATVLDDLFGFLLYTVGELAVTRHLAIDYLAPVLLDTPYTLRSHIHSRAGRKLHLRATIENNHAHVVTTATALFLIVDIDHFLTPPDTTPRRRPRPLHTKTNKALRWTVPDVSL